MHNESYALHLDYLGAEKNINSKRLSLPCQQMICFIKMKGLERSTVSARSNKKNIIKESWVCPDHVAIQETEIEVYSCKIVHEVNDLR